ncbi:single-stranded DNA-binding protein [Camelimonas fluminis]|uniref:Single-stranded DNA-binding protein n=1 Tax=Camelimonas fluminis TaxID=1576911 RepID=A0ABV7UIE9_9HYPH|nr:single-stranded DNA-binding protein [Camelimonas fluminis]GHE82382.1 single-stranded DNA-binding protein [Camelimonas fluminis]
MSDFNQVIISGRLGADPETRRMQDGSPVVNMRIACSDYWRDKNSGERKERTEWIPVVIFNENLAKVAEKFLRKGSKAQVCGKWQTRKWTDQNGQERYTTEVVLQRYRGELTILDGKRDDAGPRDMADAERQYAQRGGRDLSAEADRAYDRNVAGAGFGGTRPGQDLSDQIPF